MIYTEVKNVSWANQTHTSLVCEVTFDGIGTIPFSPNANDCLPHSVEIWNRALAGDFGPVADWVEPPMPTNTENQIPVVIPGAEGGIL